MRLPRHWRWLAILLFFAAAGNLYAEGGADLAQRRAWVTKVLSTDRASGFRAMDQVFAYHRVARGGPVAELARAPRKLEVSYEFNGQSHTLDELLARTATQGFLVIKGGSVVDERYVGGADDKSRFTSWSMAKSMTSMLVGIALAEGKIHGVDDPVTAYLPELKSTAYDGVSIRDILEMSSGVEFTEDENNTASDLWKMWMATMVTGSETFSDYTRSIKRRLDAPGSRWAYRSIDTGVLGMLLNRVTERPLASQLSDKVWQPLGMEQDATWLTDKSGLEAAYCCINATLRDYGRFGLMMLHRGKVGGKQIVPEQWIAQSTSPQGPQVNYGQLWPTIFPDDTTGYGYQWWLPYGGEAHPYSAVGLCYQFIYVNPRYDLVIVKVSAPQVFFSVPGQNEQFAAFDAIGRVLSSNP